jgi:hypothetical protein
MIYKKLKRTWSHSYANYIPNFTKVFPELKKLSKEELCDRFIELNLEFYSEEKTPVTFWLRLTLPFALIAMLIMIIGLPVMFLISGNWHYNLGEKCRLYNWFKALRLLNM